MKKIIGLFIFATVSLLFFAQNFNAQENSNDGLVRNLDVRLEKRSSFLLEPIFVKFKYTLPSTENAPDFSKNMLVKVYFKEKIKEYCGLTRNISKSVPQSLPGQSVIKSDKDSGLKYFDYEKEEVIDRSGEFFTKPGDYKLQFILPGAISNLVEITIEEPTGINKQAFDFLNQHEGNISFDWVWKEKNGISLLEIFVDKYGDSVYGETAIQILGTHYFFRDEQDKAQAAFEKIKNSPHKPVFENAKQFLSDIENRKAELRKQK